MPETTSPDRYLTRPGSQLAYSTHGAGPVAISGHGLSSSRAAAEQAGMSFAALADRGRTLVEYDARGHGRSTGRPIPADYSWSTLAGDLIALADELSPDAPVDAIGASMGCATILHAVVRAPERFRRLVLVIPPTAWETRALIASGYELQATLVEERGIAGLLEMTAGFPNPPALPPGLRLEPDVDESLLPSVFRGAALSEFPSPAEIAAIAQPVLILAWAGDAGHPLSTAEKLVELLPGTELHVAQGPADLGGWVELADAFLSADPHR